MALTEIWRCGERGDSFRCFGFGCHFINVWEGFYHWDGDRDWEANWNDDTQMESKTYKSK